MYRLVIKLRGITYYFECDTIGEAYRVAKLVAAILKVRTKKPTRKSTHQSTTSATSKNGLPRARLATSTASTTPKA